ncbi:hypothetical protein D3C80_1229090 [compost metagenome]
MAAGSHRLCPGRQRLRRAGPCARLGQPRRAAGTRHRTPARRLAGSPAGSQPPWHGRTAASGISRGMATRTPPLDTYARRPRPRHQPCPAAGRWQPAGPHRYALRQGPGGAYRPPWGNPGHRHRTLWPLPRAALLRPGQCRGRACDRWLGRPASAAPGLAYGAGGVAARLPVRAVRPAAHTDRADPLPRWPASAAGECRRYLRAGHSRCDSPAATADTGAR